MSNNPVNPYSSQERNYYYASVQQELYSSYYLPQNNGGNPQDLQTLQNIQSQQQLNPQFQSQPLQYPQQYPLPQQGVVQQYQSPQQYAPQQANNDEKNGLFSKFNDLKPTIVYQNMTVEQWNNIDSDETKYSKYWDCPDAFEPETFSANTQEETKWNDIGWMIVFWINFLAFLALFIVLVVKGTKEAKSFFKTDDSNSKILLYYDDDDHHHDDYYDYISKPSLPSNILGYTVGLGLAIGVVINILHSLYILFAPKFYIYFGFFICVIISIICVIPALLLKLWAALIFPVITALICLCAYCCLKNCILISSHVLKYACKLLWRNPTLFLAYFIQSLIQIVVAIMFILSLVFTVILGWHFAIIIYYLFAFYWISLTSTYVIYLITAGVAAQDYFLAGTEYMPKMAVWSSVKRGMTTSFGSASFAGFIIAVINILEHITSYALNCNNACISILALIAMCVLSCIRCCFDKIARNALIYCATFGVPFLEGCRRWFELDMKKFIGTIANNVIISSALNLHLFAFTIGAAMVGLGIGYAINKKDAFTMVLMFFACAIYTILLFDLLNEPIITLSDSIFVCFAECPEILKIRNNELYEQFVRVYGDELTKHLSNNI